MAVSFKYGFLDIPGYFFDNRQRHIFSDKITYESVSEIVKAAVLDPRLPAGLGDQHQTVSITIVKDPVRQLTILFHMSIPLKDIQGFHDWGQGDGTFLKIFRFFYSTVRQHGFGDLQTHPLLLLKILVGQRQTFSNTYPRIVEHIKHKTKLRIPVNPQPHKTGCMKIVVQFYPFLMGQDPDVVCLFRLYIVCSVEGIVIDQPFFVGQINQLAECGVNGVKRLL